MSVLFMDSYSHYVSAAQKYQAVGDAGVILNNPSFARTGIGYLKINSGTAGPQRQLGANFPKLIGQIAFQCDVPGPADLTGVMDFGVLGDNFNIRIEVNASGSISVIRGAGTSPQVQVTESVTRPFVYNTWNYIEAQCLFDSVNGSVVVNVNGREVINISGLRTVCTSGNNFSNYVQLLGATTNGPNTELADFVIIDWSTAPNNSFIDAAKVYVEVPNANGATIQWTPLSGQNFANVNEVPPDGDTSYNSSSTVGQTDQYQHPNTGLPGGATILASQHCQCAKVDSGARTIASDLAGNVGAAEVLTTTYTIYCTPRDSDPSPFPVSAGPQVTA